MHNFLSIMATLIVSIALSITMATSWAAETHGLVRVGPTFVEMDPGSSIKDSTNNAKPVIGGINTRRSPSDAPSAGKTTSKKSAFKMQNGRITFGAVQFAPDKTRAKQKIAHEATHVVQQRK
jgi:hypothetical protein